MTTSPDLSWADTGTCPSWCATSERHLSDRLRRRHDDLWHEGASVRVMTEETDHNWQPIAVELNLSQHVEVTAHGPHLHPVAVTLSGDGMTPGNARKLAAVLMDLADEAERLTI